MTTFTMPSLQAQNNFGALLDAAQRKIVTVTRRGRPAALVVSPNLIDDYLDGVQAMKAAQSGFASKEETQAFFRSLNHV